MNSPDLIPVPEEEPNWLKKYTKRGIDLSVSLQSWPEHDRHVCRKDGECPQTIRSLHDTHGMFINFSNTLGGQYTHPDPGLGSVIWCLEAGKSCRDWRPYSGGFAYSSH